MKTSTEFHSFITQWLLPLGYIEQTTIKNNTNTSYPFIKEGMTIMCIFDGFNNHYQLRNPIPTSKGIHTGNITSKKYLLPDKCYKLKEAANELNQQLEALKLFASKSKIL